MDAKATLLRHFAPEVRAAYERACLGNDPGAVDTVVLAVLGDHVPDKGRRSAAAPDDTAALVTDLGLDSIAIAEMVFFLEDLFEVSINNGEIAGVRTVGDLRAFIRGKLDRIPAPPRA
jgi:acyl carrier protein